MKLIEGGYCCLPCRYTAFRGARNEIYVHCWVQWCWEECSHNGRYDLTGIEVSRFYSQNTQLSSTDLSHRPISRSAYHFGSTRSFQHWCFNVSLSNWFYVDVLCNLLHATFVHALHQLFLFFFNYLAWTMNHIHTIYIPPTCMCHLFYFHYSNAHCDTILIAPHIPVNLRIKPRFRLCAKSERRSSSREFFSTLKIISRGLIDYRQC